MGSVDARPNPRARPRIRPRQERESRFVRCVAARNDETAALLSTVAAATGSPDMMNRYSSADDINDASDIIVVPIRSNFFHGFIPFLHCVCRFVPTQLRAYGSGGRCYRNSVALEIRRRHLL